MSGTSMGFTLSFISKYLQKFEKKNNETLSINLDLIGKICCYCDINHHLTLCRRLALAANYTNQQ